MTWMLTWEKREIVIEIGKNTEVTKMRKDQLWTLERYAPYPKLKKERRSLLGWARTLIGLEYKPDREVEQTIRLLQEVGRHERCIQLARGLLKMRDEITKENQD